MKVILSEQFDQAGTRYAPGEVVDLKPDSIAERLILAGRAVPGDQSAADQVALLSVHSPNGVVDADGDLAEQAARTSKAPDARSDDPAKMKKDALKSELDARGVSYDSDAKVDDLREQVVRYRDTSKFTVDELKADLDAKDIAYEHDAHKDALLEAHGQAYPAPATDHAAASDGGWNPSDYPLEQFPGVVSGPMGDGTVGGAFVAAGARVNTGGPLGPEKAELDAKLLDEDRSRVFPGPSAGDAVAESGAAVNTGGPYGDGTLGAEGFRTAHLNDGVPRADLSDSTGNVSRPNSLDDGVPRADLSVLADDLARTEPERIRAAKGIGTADYSPVSEQELGVSPTGGAVQ